MAGFENIVNSLDPNSALVWLSVLVIVGAAWGVERSARRFRRTVEELGDTVLTSGLSGRAVARQLLQACNLADVGVVRSTVKDRYNFKKRQVELASENYQGAGISAAATAAHEVGHAQQFAAGMLVCRVVPIARWTFGGVIVAGGALLALGFAGELGFGAMSLTAVSPIVVALVFAALALSTAVVLPLEFDASRRAKNLTDQVGLFATADEKEKFDRVLRCASLTYVVNVGYRWLALGGMVLALIFLSNWESRLTEDAMISQPGTPAQISGLAQPVTGETIVSQLSGPTRNSGYEQLMMLLAGMQWLGVFALVAVFLLLGRLGKKLTAPQQAIRQNQAGAKLLDRGKYEAAIREFTRALKLDAKLAVAYSNRATAYRKLNRLDEAMADFDMAVGCSPGLTEAILGRAEVWLRRGERDRALADCDQALRLAPESAAALVLRGNILLESQETLSPGRASS